MAVRTLSSPAGSNSVSRTDGPGWTAGGASPSTASTTLAVSDRLGQVVGPGHPPVLAVDPVQERRDHLAQLGQQQVGVAAGLGQGGGPQAQQQGLVRLPGGEDAEVGGGGGRQQAAQAVEGPGLDGPPPGGLARPRLLG